MTTHKVVKHDEWLKARKKRLAKAKEFTRMRDQLSREPRELPWERVYKLAPPLRMREELGLSVALVVLGMAYVVMA